MSSEKYRPWNPDQMVLFPDAMKDALEEGHMVFRILDVVESLDLSSVMDRMDESDPRGTRPYHPRMMLALLMYAYCCGIYSSREIAAATYDIIPFRVLTADQHPHFTVINEFRLRHLDAFVDLFVEVLRLCGRAGLLDLEHVSLDGSKVEANASKHKAMSYGRMEEEADRLARGGSRPDSDEGGQDRQHDLSSHRLASTPTGRPRPEAQRNFTDPDSRIMKRGATYLQGYNCQIAVDGANQVIVAEGVTNQAPDQEHLIPMMKRTRRNTGRLPKGLTADAGYMSEENVEFCQRRDIDAYLAVSRAKHASSRDEEAPPQEKRVWRAMRDKLSTDKGRQIYSRRKVIAEPVFGQTKQARGFRRFSLRGLEKVRAEWTLVCLCSNLLKLVNAPLPCDRVAAKPA